MKTPFLKSVLPFLFAFEFIKVAAEDSKKLAANGGDRTHLGSSTVLSPQFPFPSLGIMKVYAKVGETIYMGSSAQGIAANPAVAGGNAPISSVNNELVQNPNSFYIEAFDVSVKSTANAVVSGRVFINLFSGNTSNVTNNYGSFNSIFTVLTKDSYKYTVNLNGMQWAAPTVACELFFNAPAADLPDIMPSAVGQIWDVNSIVDPILSHLSFRGVEETANLAGTNQLSGSFTFRSSVPCPYQGSIDIDKNGYRYN